MVTTIPASFIMRRFGRRVGFIAGALVGGLGGVINVIALMNNHFILFIIGSALIGVQAVLPFITALLLPIVPMKIVAHAPFHWSWRVV